MADTFAIIGNCQAAPLSKILQLSERFNNRFAVQTFPAVHVAKPSDVDALHTHLMSSEIKHVLTQNVTEAYRGGIGLGTQTLRERHSYPGEFLTWPSIYFSGYNPELFYLKDANKASVATEFDYHHRVIFNCYLGGETIEGTVRHLQRPDAQIASGLGVEAELSNLAKREALLGVKVADFIRGHYQSSRLFWTFNHPSADVILNVAGQVLHLLGLANDLPSPATEILNNTIYPVLPAVRTLLGLQFGADDTVRIRNAEYSIEQVVGKYFHFYDSNPDLVALNKG